MLGRSTEATKGAVAAQDLWSHYLDSGVTKTAKLSDATGGLADAVRDYGVRAQEAADRADKLAKAQASIVEASDMARGGLSSILSGGLLSAAHGQGFSTGARSALSSFGESLLQKGVSGGINMLTGGAGNPLGFGSLFSSPAARGGFGSYGPQLPDTGGVGTVLAHLLGGFFGGAHATGGRIAGPGTGTSDSITAQLSNGEYVVRADAARRYGDLLDRINNETMPRFATGGEVEVPDAPTVTMPRGPVIGGGSEGGGGMGGHHTFHITLGDLQIHPASGDQFSKSQLDDMTRMHADTQQKAIIGAVDQVTRNLPAIQGNSLQGN